VEMPPDGQDCGKPNSRRDLLKQIDIDLLAVEDALSRRRHSLAQIDKKLSELQSPGGQGTTAARLLRGEEVAEHQLATEATASAVIEAGTHHPCSASHGPSRVSAQQLQAVAPEPARAPAAALQTPWVNRRSDELNFTEWLQDHKDFCNGIQQAQRNQEQQERALQRRRIMLENQLVSLQMQIESLPKAEWPSVGAVSQSPSASSTSYGGSLHAPIDMSANATSSVVPGAENDTARSHPRTVCRSASSPTLPLTGEANPASSRTHSPPPSCQVVRREQYLTPHMQPLRMALHSPPPRSVHPVPCNSVERSASTSVLETASPVAADSGVSVLTSNRSVCGSEAATSVTPRMTSRSTSRPMLTPISSQPRSARSPEASQSVRRATGTSLILTSTPLSTRDQQQQQQTRSRSYTPAAATFPPRSNAPAQRQASSRSPTPQPVVTGPTPPMPAGASPAQLAAFHRQQQLRSSDAGAAPPCSMPPPPAAAAAAAAAPNFKAGSAAIPGMRRDPRLQQFQFFRENHDGTPISRVPSSKDLQVGVASEASQRAVPAGQQQQQQQQQLPLPQPLPLQEVQARQQLLAGVQPPAPLLPGRGVASPAGGIQPSRVSSHSSSLGCQQSFSEVKLGSFAEGLEQWRPPANVGSCQARSDVMFAPVVANAMGGPNATYTGPQPLPRGQPQCPVQ